MPHTLEKYEADRTPELIGLYGGPGTGKTTLATSLPWGPKWGERAIYVAIDPRSAGLRPVLPENRSRLIRAVPAESLISGRRAIDMNAELVAIFSRDWKREFPDVGTMIVDTITLGAEAVLPAVAEAAAFSGNPISFGTGAAKTTLPAPGDYLATQSIAKRWFMWLEQQPLNVIALFHQEWIEPDSGVSVISGGPTTVGKASVRDLPRKFEHLFYCTTREEVVPGQPPRRVTKYEVHTSKTGIWEAKLRVPGPNPMPTVDVTNDPAKFWRQFDVATK